MITKWAKHHIFCVSCSGTSYFHHGCGYCEACYPRKKGRIVSGREYSPLIPWFKYPDGCVNCRTTDVPHKGHGYCRYCYYAIFRRNLL